MVQSESDTVTAVSTLHDSLNDLQGVIELGVDLRAAVRDELRVIEANAKTLGEALDRSLERVVAVG